MRDTLPHDVDSALEMLRFGCPLDKPLGDQDVAYFERRVLKAADILERALARFEQAELPEEPLEFTKTLRLMLCGLSIAIGRWEVELHDKNGAQDPDKPERVPTSFLRSIESFLDYIEMHEKYLSALRAHAARMTVERDEANERAEEAITGSIVWQTEWTSISVVAKELKERAEAAERRADEIAGAIRNALLTNGGPIDHADTVDGKAYVMVEMEAFLAMQKIDAARNEEAKP